MRSIVSALFLGLSLILAGTVGTSSQPWHWGPSLLALAAALAAWAALPAKGETPLRALSPVAWLPVVLAAGWLVLRAVFSPVPAQAWLDLALVAACAGGFWLCQEIARRKVAIRVLAALLLVLVAAQSAVVWIQLESPDFSPLYGTKPVTGATGFFVHYIFFANFTAGLSLLLLGLACFGRGPVWWRGLLGIGFGLGAACVFLSKARGGGLALVAGLFVFLLLALLLLKQRKSRIFPAMAITGAVVLLAGFAAVPMLFRHLQATRGYDDSVAAFMDNDARLQYAELGVETLLRHPWTGGGSRSFSWEYYTAWNLEESGWMANDVVYVHNELLQAATDYGLMGAGLALLAVATILIHAVAVRFSDPDESSASPAGGVFVGAVAGASAILTESFFSFALHLLPSALLLGCCLGLAAGTTRVLAGDAAATWARAGRGISRFAAVGVGVAVAFAGWRGTRALRALWPVETGRFAALENVGPQLAEANAAWPSHMLALRRAGLSQEAASRVEGDEKAALLEQAVEGYLQAFELHPHLPATAVNLANALSIAGRWDESEEWFARAADMQGGVIAAFGTRYYYAQHLARRGWELWQQRKPSEAYGYYLAAFRQLDHSFHHVPLIVEREERMAVRESIEKTIEFFKTTGIEPVEVPDPVAAAEKP